MRFFYFFGTRIKNMGLLNQLRYQKKSWKYFKIHTKFFQAYTKPKRGSEFEKENNIKLGLKDKIKENLEKAKINVGKNVILSY